MDARASPELALVVGTGMASRKLLLLLETVELLPEAAQDQVAAAMEELVLQLLHACRCENSAVWSILVEWL